MDSEIKNLIRAGVVSAVNVAKHRARVTFEDKDDVVSGELPILTAFAEKNKCYRLPDVGESVLCLMLPNSTESGEGFIIGSYFNDVDTPNANSQDVSRIDFSDGTFIEYNRSSHKLSINCVGDIEIKGANIYLN